MRLSATCRLGGSYTDFLTVDFRGVISFRFVPFFFRLAAPEGERGEPTELP